MNREELEALSGVLYRRLHNTRDPELQALLWQLAEYADEVTTHWRATNECLRDVIERVSAYRSTYED